MNEKINKRSLLLLLVFTIITLGIYGLYWHYKFAKDINTVCEGDGNHTRGLLACLFFGLITLGIYNLVWLYMVEDRMQDNAPRYGFHIKEGGGTILLWYILGTFIVVGPFIAAYILIKNINALGSAYNKYGLPVDESSNNFIEKKEKIGISLDK
ncbi:MAG: DUF4234 domain-containing protein [Fusobacteriaceae bacterium]|jgi:hypothetical protein|nr:DUF4234 domain-containing protein [Fusobacteriaceae bacterium]